MSEKKEVLREIKKTFLDPSLELADVDESKPWGAYYRVANKCASEFVRLYFDESTITQARDEGEISPKLLVFEPGNYISLQYHERRAEIWKVLSGKLLASMSYDDEIAEMIEYDIGDQLSYGAQVRHKAGSPSGGEWTVVAEIWQHTNPNHLSDENDIIRLQDDYGRS